MPSIFQLLKQHIKNIFRNIFDFQTLFFQKLLPFEKSKDVSTESDILSKRHFTDKNIIKALGF